MPGHKNNKFGSKRRPMSEEEREALRARQERKERNIREQKKAAASRVSYVRKPVSGRSVIGMVLTVIALALGGYCIYLGYDTYGQMPFSAGGPALCSILCGLAAFIYHICALRERDTNGILSKIGVVFAAALLLVWVMILVIGTQGS